MSVPQDVAEQATATVEPNTSPSTDAPESGSKWFDDRTGRTARLEALERRLEATSDPDSRGVQSGGAEQAAASDPAPAEQSAESAETPVTETADTSAPYMAFKTEQEFKAYLDRAVQSETDRREAARKKERLKQLATTDEDAFLEESKKLLTEEEQAAEREEAARQTATLIQNVTRDFDNTVLAPVFKRLPEKEVQRIFAAKPVGVEGRASALTAAVEALVAQTKAETRKALKSDEAFRKELLAELRGVDEEPINVPGSGAAALPFDMNTAIRRFAGRA